MPRSLLPRGFFVDTATVYTEDPTTTAHTVVAQAALPCRLEHLNLRPAPSGFQRADLAAIRTLLWDATYVMPETAVINVRDTRWNVVSGTFGHYRGPNNESVYRQCDVVRGEAA